MILGLQTDAFGPFGGIPTYNRLVCRVLNEFDSSVKSSVLIAMDKPEHISRQLPLHPNLHLAGFGGDRIQFARSALRTVLGNHVTMVLASHVNYAPLSLFLKVLRPGMRFGVLIYGWDVWDKISLVRRLALQQADFIISISEYTKRRAISANGINEERVFVVPNALEWKTNETVEPEIRPLLPHGTKLLSVGRLSNSEQQKGFDTVIESLPALTVRIPDVQYIVIGSGTDLERHRQLALELGVSERVHFLGTVDEKTLRYYYRCCDVFVMPSAQEGFGFVYLEAMHYAKAIVAANSGGAPEVVKEGITGSLVQYGDKDQLAKTLIDLCLDRNKRQRLGQAGYQRLQEQFTFPHFKQKLTEILMTELVPRVAN